MEAKRASAQDDLAQHNGSSRITILGEGVWGVGGGGLQSYQYHATLHQ